MTWLRKLTALLLLAVWLPVTSHCALEMAGMLPTSGCCANDSSGHCTKDNCEELESNLFNPGADSALVKAPIVACACLICTALANAVPPDLVSAQLEGPIEVKDDWVPGWTFDHRLALPARAPSLS